MARLSAGRLVVFGKLVVDEVLELAHPVRPGSQQRALTHEVRGGGQVWHTARAAAARGTPVTVAGWRGADDTSRHLADALEVHGVTDALVARGRASRALVLVGPDGDRAIVSVAGSGGIRVTDVDPERLLAGTAWLHVDGYALDTTCGAAALATARAAERAGIPLSLETPSVAGIPARRRWLGMLPPLALLVGRPDEVDAADLSVPPTAVAVHDGPRPVALRRGDRQVAVAVPAADVATNGAGDRFTGGLLAALLAGRSDEDALATAVAAAQRER